MTGNMARARRRDRRVYLGSHPLLFALLSASRARPVLRWGSSVVVNDPAAFRTILTRLPLDRVAAGTTGGVAHRAGPDRVLFDQDGPAHRQARRQLTADLSAPGVARLRPVWLAVLGRRLAPLAVGEAVDIVDLTAELAGATAAALLGSTADPGELATAARDVAAGAVRAHLPRLRRAPADVAVNAAADPTAHAAHRLAALLAPPTSGAGGAGLSAMPGLAGLPAMLAVAAINTTVAGFPRAVAWCADADLWDDAADAERRPVLVSELLRVVAPTPLLPRAAAAGGRVAGRRVHRGDRLLLVARHAGLGHRRDPDCDNPVSPQLSRLIFGAGAHACPGADLARAQLDDLLRLLATHRPRVATARTDRHAALPGWAVLIVRATR